jgi:hypothetical protein
MGLRTLIQSFRRYHPVVVMPSEPAFAPNSQPAILIRLMQPAADPIFNHGTDWKQVRKIEDQKLKLYRYLFLNDITPEQGDAVREALKACEIDYIEKQTSTASEKQDRAEEAEFKRTGEVKLPKLVRQPVIAIVGPGDLFTAFGDAILNRKQFRQRQSEPATPGNTCQ